VTLPEMLAALAGRQPVEEVPVNWDAIGYTSEPFNSTIADLDSFPWDEDLPTGEETRIIVDLLGAQPSDHLLDMACGYGRHALVLAAEYHLQVTGIDISPGSIAAARRRAQERNLNIDFNIAHGRELSLESEFDHALIAFNSLSLFSPQDAPVLLENIHRALRPGGRLFVDLDNKPYNCRYGTADTNWTTWPGGLALQEIYFHRDISIEVGRDLTFAAGADEMEEFLLFKRIYDAGEIDTLMTSCDFQIDHLYGDWDLSPLTGISPKIILVAVRN
jgi:SAM-dependent methyltransferase